MPIPSQLALLHTSSVHISTFETLFEDLAPDIPLPQIVGEGLLDEARPQGLSPDLTRRAHQTILAAGRRRAGGAGQAGPHGFNLTPDGPFHP